jgi:hypothetical protein
VFFRGRKITPSDFDSTTQTWHGRAVTENGPGWSMSSTRSPGITRCSLQSTHCFGAVR